MILDPFGTGGAPQVSAYGGLVWVEAPGKAEPFPSADGQSHLAVLPFQDFDTTLSPFQRRFLPSQASPGGYHRAGETCVI
jgi:hypothetical protein